MWSKIVSFSKGNDKNIADDFIVHNCKVTNSQLYKCADIICKLGVFLSLSLYNLYWLKGGSILIILNIILRNKFTIFFHLATLFYALKIIPLLSAILLKYLLNCKLLILVTKKIIFKLVSPNLLFSNWKKVKCWVKHQCQFLLGNKLFEVP